MYNLFTSAYFDVVNLVLGNRFNHNEKCLLLSQIPINIYPSIFIYSLIDRIDKHLPFFIRKIKLHATLHHIG